VFHSLTTHFALQRARKSHSHIFLSTRSALRPKNKAYAKSAFWLWLRPRTRWGSSRRSARPDSRLAQTSPHSAPFITSVFSRFCLFPILLRLHATDVEMLVFCATVVISMYLRFVNKRPPILKPPPSLSSATRVNNSTTVLKRTPFIMETSRCVRAVNT